MDLSDQWLLNSPKWCLFAGIFSNETRVNVGKWNIFQLQKSLLNLANRTEVDANALVFKRAETYSRADWAPQAVVGGAGQHGEVNIGAYLVPLPSSLHTVIWWKLLNNKQVSGPVLNECFQLFLENICQCSIKKYAPGFRNTLLFPHGLENVTEFAWLVCWSTRDHNKFTDLGLSVLWLNKTLSRLLGEMLTLSVIIWKLAQFKCHRGLM